MCGHLFFYRRAAVPAEEIKKAAEIRVYTGISYYF